VWFDNPTMQPMFNVCNGMPPDELYNFLLGFGDHWHMEDGSESVVSLFRTEYTS
jgi:hypothetical protein